jgi:hypothetical protein
MATYSYKGRSYKSKDAARAASRADKGRSGSSSSASKGGGSNSRESLEKQLKKKQGELREALEKEIKKKQGELKRAQQKEAEGNYQYELAQKEQKVRKSKYDSSVLTKSPEYKALSKEDQEAVLAVFGAVANNDQVMAKRLAEAFKVAQKKNDPYFAQQLRLASDAIERGYVEIDKEAEFKALQAQNRLEDLRKDYAAKKDNLSLEEASVMKDIERGYQQNLETLQTGLAEAGFTSSSRRVQKERILDEATGGLRESKQRAFAYDRSSLEDVLGRGERDTQSELARLNELTKSGKLDFLRSAEREIGSSALDKLNLPGEAQMLGGIYGDIPEKKLQNTISAMQGLVF